MIIGYQLGDDGVPVPVENIQDLNIGKRIAETEFDEVRISTIFLAIDHDFSNSDMPVLFETMVFTPKGWDDECIRSTSKKTALWTHRAVLFSRLARKFPRLDVREHDLEIA